MRGIEWFKIAVPLFFLLVWAINQVINNQPRPEEKLPAGRRPGGGGPPRDDAGADWEPTPPLARPRTLNRSGDPDIVILEMASRPLRSPAPRTSGSPRGRRAARRPTANTAPAQPKRDEPPRTKKALEAPPLGATATTGQASAEITRAVSAWPDETPQLKMLRQALASPESARQMFLLKEVFDRPLALRHPGGRHRL